MSWVSTLQSPAWEGTLWTIWARGPARCPGPGAPLQGRVRRTTCEATSPTNLPTSVNIFCTWVKTRALLCSLFIWDKRSLVISDFAGWQWEGGGGEVFSWGWKHVTPGGGEAWKEGCVRSSASWLGVWDEVWIEYRRQMAVGKQGDVAQFKCLQIKRLSRTIQLI